MLIALILSAVTINAQPTYSFIPNFNHVVTLSEASTETKAYRDDAPSGSETRFLFGKVALQSVLSQTGSEGLVIYLAKDSYGRTTLVIVGADSTGNDMASTNHIILNRSLCCSCWGGCATLIPTSLNSD